MVHLFGAIMISRRRSAEACGICVFPPVETFIYGRQNIYNENNNYLYHSIQKNVFVNISLKRSERQK